LEPLVAPFGRGLLGDVWGLALLLAGSRAV
jgi:hypothetical protein